MRVQGNCPVEGSIDFGRGPVLVRCTVVEPHTNHICQVEIAIPEGKNHSVNHSVFEEGKSNDDIGEARNR